MAKSPMTFIAKARSWTKRRGLHGPGAFLRFVMMTFVERLNQVSDDFVFKGGNLLWLYIKTPRATVDLDFATRHTGDHVAVENILQKVCLNQDAGLRFTIKSFTTINRPEGSGAAVRIAYRTIEGQANEFEIDVVYASPTLVQSIPAPVTEGVTIIAATVENIIADKLSASQKFKSGNTRMKDFDDLWRISKSELTVVDWQVLADLLAKRGIKPELDEDWIHAGMLQSWSAHQSGNSDLPENLRTLMTEVNHWLRDV
jgi:hypothetical protein